MKLRDDATRRDALRVLNSEPVATWPGGCSAGFVRGKPSTPCISVGFSFKRARLSALRASWRPY